MGFLVTKIMNNDEPQFEDYDKLSVEDALFVLNEQDSEEAEAEQFDSLCGTGFGVNDTNEEELELIREAKEEAKIELAFERGDIPKKPFKELVMKKEAIDISDMNYEDIEKQREKDYVKRVIKHCIKNITPYIEQDANGKWKRKE